MNNTNEPQVHIAIDEEAIPLGTEVIHFSTKSRGIHCGNYYKAP